MYREGSLQPFLNLSSGPDGVHIVAGWMGVDAAGILSRWISRVYLPPHPSPETVHAAIAEALCRQREAALASGKADT